MKYLAISDNQLGVATVTLDSQEAVWDQAVTLAIENRVDGVLHAGDLFEHAIVEGQVLAAFRRPLARLREAGIPMLLIRGNHDGAVRPVDALDVFHEYDGLTVSQRPEIVEIGGAVVVTLPWVSPKHLVAASNGAARENVYEAAGELLVGIARDLRDEIEARHARAHRGDTVPVILLLHWSVSGASLPTGMPVDRLREVVLPWPDLDALGFDAVVCGHLHARQTFANPWALGFYCGSPQPLNHGESNEPHGVWLYDSSAAEAGFIPLDSPQFVTHDVEAEILALSPVWPNVGEGDIVRVRYTATREQDATIDKSAIRRELLAAGASRVTIEPTIIREARTRAEHLTENLTELDALAAYADAQGFEAGLRERMLERTAEWLA